MSLIDKFLLVRAADGNDPSNAASMRIVPLVTTRQRLPEHNADTLLSLSNKSGTIKISLNTSNGGAKFIWGAQEPFGFDSIWEDS